MATPDLSPARTEVVEKAIDELYEHGEVDSKALEALIGIGDGVSKTRDGDQMCLDLKSEARCHKPRKGVASFALTPGARAAITRKINARDGNRPVHEDPLRRPGRPPV